jgi:hypothetical protein
MCDAVGAILIESADPELCRQHHQPEQQRQRGQIDPPDCLAEAGSRNGDHQRGCHCGRTGAVSPEAGDATHGHRHVGQGKDREDDVGGYVSSHFQVLGAS